MCIFIEIAMFILGCLTLARGRFMVHKARVVEGLPAFFLAIILMTPLALCFWVAVLMAALSALSAGPFKWSDLMPLQGAELVLVFLALGSALAISVWCSKPAQKEPQDSPEQPAD